MKSFTNKLYFQTQSFQWIPKGKKTLTIISLVSRMSEGVFSSWKLSCTTIIKCIWGKNNSTVCIYLFKTTKFYRSKHVAQYLIFLFFPLPTSHTNFRAVYEWHVCGDVSNVIRKVFKLESTGDLKSLRNVRCCRRYSRHYRGHYYLYYCRHQNKWCEKYRRHGSNTKRNVISVHILADSHHDLPLRYI